MGSYALTEVTHSLVKNKLMAGTISLGLGLVKEFDDVVFSAEIGKVQGPVQTQFGFHLIEITSRTE